MTTFGTLNPNGNLTKIRVINQSDLLNCPFYILMPDHYREDASCKCDDGAERLKMIREWGYQLLDFANIPLRKG